MPAQKLALNVVPGLIVQFVRIKRCRPMIFAILNVKEVSLIPSISIMTWIMKLVWMLVPMVHTLILCTVRLAMSFVRTVRELLKTVHYVQKAYICINKSVLKNARKNGNPQRVGNALTVGIFVERVLVSRPIPLRLMVRIQFLWNGVMILQ
jgi:hypothetical protein